jgi:hypothetical protein
VPADPAALAKYLGWSTEDVKAGLTERVLSFFEESDGELVSPKLEEHWEKHLRLKKKQVEGGIEGAKRRYNKDLKDARLPIGQPISRPIGQPMSKPIGSLNSIKSNQIKSNQVQSLEKEVVIDDWLDGYDSVPEQETVISNREKVRVSV